MSTKTIPNAPAASAVQRADGFWLPTLDGNATPYLFVSKDAAVKAARRRIHDWWHRDNAMDLRETQMSTCEECNA